jgi:hypothetical protein
MFNSSEFFDRISAKLSVLLPSSSNEVLLNYYSPRQPHSRNRQYPPSTYKRLTMSKPNKASYPDIESPEHRICVDPTTHSQLAYRKRSMDSHRSRNEQVVPLALGEHGSFDRVWIKFRDAVCGDEKAGEVDRRVTGENVADCVDVNNSHDRIDERVGVFEMENVREDIDSPSRSRAGRSSSSIVANQGSYEHSGKKLGFDKGLVEFCMQLELEQHDC